MTNEQISSILIDSDNKITIAPGSPLRLDEDYELAIKSINADGKVSVELSKNGSVVDSKVFQPSINNARMSDKTYYYKKDLGDTKEIVIIAVHFKDAFHVDTEIAVVDGIFQISDTPLSIKVDQQYGKLSIREADPIRFSIVMDNKDNRITLSKDKVTELLPNVFIRTADQYFAPDKPLRYYIFKKCNCPAVK
jgi:S-layer protein (TIGR01567 family)